ncbi:helix-turn-helix domain-containing protein, partial [Microbacterium sp.]|uniref:helix-turn-helix domain-containing protein n=1 Tax=Actinomycetes TaxID=1760 RepID=UPI0037C739F0
MSTNVIPFRGRRIPTWTFGERMRKVRRELGMTQQEMASRLGVGAPAYSAWESGRHNPGDRADLAVQLEQISGVAREWFLGWADESPRPDGPDGGATSRLGESNSRPIHYMRTRFRPELIGAAA